MNIRRQLELTLSDALAAAGAPQGAPAMVAQTANPQYGDYQANGVMPAAKKLKCSPRDLAEKVLAEANLTGLADDVQIAGPGFINVTLANSWLARQLTDEARRSAQVGPGRFAPPADNPQIVVIDYSSPNLAKEMHVGHLRSTVIGDALARTLHFLGHNVIRQNHVGDWGTQFGMLTAYMQEHTEDDASSRPELTDLEEFYRHAKQRFDSDPTFADKARGFVVRLQSGDETTLRILNRFRTISLAHCQRVYDALGVTLTPDDIRGESSYDQDLSRIIQELDKKGLLTESKGAKCVFLDDFTNKDGQITPFIVQKSDGGYLYSTTDLAAIRYRIGMLGAQRLLYVTGAEQTLHFQQLFAVARKAGFAPQHVSLEHVAFGMMLGHDRRRFRTRQGGTVKLMDLLTEAVDKAYELVSAKSPHLPDADRREIARVVGIGAVKYADLSQNRTSDYVFSWDKMLSLEGNTAPYMQYAYARIRSIFRKGEVDPGDVQAPGDAAIGQPAERTLAVKLLQLQETLDSVAEDCLPNILCNHLYDLAGAFMGFYETCPVLKAHGAARSLRLFLCDLTARTIWQGLNLLGIETIEQM